MVLPDVLAPDSKKQQRSAVSVHPNCLARQSGFAAVAGMAGRVGRLRGLQVQEVGLRRLRLLHLTEDRQGPEMTAEPRSRSKDPLGLVGVLGGVAVQLLQLLLAEHPAHGLAGSLKHKTRRPEPSRQQ